MVEALFAVVALAAAGGIATYHALVSMGFIERPAGHRLKLWREAADAVRLSGVKLSSTALTGWAGSLQVHLSSYADANGYGTRVTIAGLAPALTVLSEAWSATVRAASECEVGDAAFDRTAWVEGPPALARALLDAHARLVLKGLIEGRLEHWGHSTFWATGCVQAGVLLVDVPEVTPHPRADRLSDAQGMSWADGSQAVAGLDRLPEVLRRLLDLAHRLETPRDLPGRLAQNLKTEPEGGVRLQLLTTLTRGFAGLPVTREALEAAREDPDPQVRLRAGIELGPEGTDVLAHLADGEGADDATTEKAVAALGERLPVDRALSILRGALRTRRTATARACIGVLGARGGAEASMMLARVLAVESAELAAAAAAALADTNDASAEEPLVAALDSPHDEVRIAAAQALGRVGTATSIARLKQAEADDSSLRRVARQAIASIRSRLPGAAPGQLSLAAGEEGQLSLAADDTGHLSLTGGKR